LKITANINFSEEMTAFAGDINGFWLSVTCKIMNSKLFWCGYLYTIEF